jgi:hypothetical protein
MLGYEYGMNNGGYNEFTVTTAADDGFAGHWQSSLGPTNYRATAGAQTPTQGAAGTVRDTLPERVAQRTYQASQRHDLDAVYANYDSVFTYERFGDPAGSQRRRPDDALRETKADATERAFRGWQTVQALRAV